MENLKDLLTQKVYDPKLSPLMHDGVYVNKRTGRRTILRVCDRKHLVPYIYSFLKPEPVKDGTLTGVPLDGVFKDSPPHNMFVAAPIVVCEQELRLVAYNNETEELEIYDISPGKNALQLTVPRFAGRNNRAAMCMSLNVVHHRDRRDYAVVMRHRSNINPDSVRVAYCVFDVYENKDIKVRHNEAEISDFGFHIPLSVDEPYLLYMSRGSAMVWDYFSLGKDGAKKVRPSPTDDNVKYDWIAVMRPNSGVTVGKITYESRVFQYCRMPPGQDLWIWCDQRGGEDEDVTIRFDSLPGDRRFRLSVQPIANRGVLLFNTFDGSVLLHRHPNLPMIYSG